MWCAEDPKATGLSIDPIALKRAVIGPDHLAIAAFCVLVVNDRVVALLSSVPPLTTASATHFRARVDRHHAHLTHVLQRAELHSLEGQLSVLQTQQLVLGDTLIGLREGL